MRPFRHEQTSKKGIQLDIRLQLAYLANSNFKEARRNYPPCIGNPTLCLRSPQPHLVIRISLVTLVPHHGKPHQKWPCLQNYGAKNSYWVDFSYA